MINNDDYISDVMLSNVLFASIYPSNKKGVIWYTQDKIGEILKLMAIVDKKIKKWET